MKYLIAAQATLLTSVAGIGLVFVTLEKSMFFTTAALAIYSITTLILSIYLIVKATNEILN